MHLTLDLFVLLSFCDLCMSVIEGSEGECEGLNDLLISGVDLVSKLAVVFIVAGDIIKIAYGHLLIVVLGGLLQ